MDIGRPCHGKPCFLVKAFGLDVAISLNTGFLGIKMINAENTLQYLGRLIPKKEIVQKDKRHIPLLERSEQKKIDHTIMKGSEYDLLSMFCQNEKDAALTMPAMAIIFGIANLFWASKIEVFLWLSFVIVTKFYLLFTCKKFLSQSRSKINIRAWRHRFIAVEGLNGLAWASLSIVGFWNQIDTNIAGHFTSNIFLFATLISILGIRMAFASTVMGILYAGTLPFTFSVCIRLILLQDPFYFALGSIAAGLNVYFIFLANGLHATASKMLEYQYKTKLLIQELETSRRRAEDANIAKSQFLATMSHELRTPLNAIMGFSEMIKSETLGKLSNPNYLEYAQNIHESGQHLLSLINDILDLSRIEAGRYDIHEEALWITDVVSDCRSLMRLKAKNKGISLIQNDEMKLAQIFIDERALRQICLNLIENALKFTPQGGRIILSVGSTFEGGQYLSIKDTGPGIPSEEIAKVLEPFGQGTLGRQMINSGSGLGLAIVKKLVELHDGVFELFSNQQKGTEAIVVFPRKRVHSENSSQETLANTSHQRGTPLAFHHTHLPQGETKSEQMSFAS